MATDYSWGFDFKEGHSYLIYLYEDEGSLASSPCIPTYEPRDLTEAQKLLGAGLPPGDEVNLNYKMWLMTDKDFDLYIAVGAVLLVVVLVVYWAKRVRKKK